MDGNFEENYGQLVQQPSEPETEGIKLIDILQIIRRSLVLIILVVLLATAVGGIFASKNKPTYTATAKIIVRSDLWNSSSQSSVNNGTLSGINTPDVAVYLKMKETVNCATEFLRTSYGYESSSVSSGAIATDYNENSFVMNVSYTAESATLAKAKLDSVINAASIKLKERDLFPSRVWLVNTQRKDSYTVTQSSQKVTIVLSSFLMGLVAAFLLAWLIYVLDDTVKDKSELEKLTGVSLFAFIDDETEKKDHKRKK